MDRWRVIFEAGEQRGRRMWELGSADGFSAQLWASVWSSNWGSDTCFKQRSTPTDGGRGVHLFCSCVPTQVCTEQSFISVTLINMSFLFHPLRVSVSSSTLLYYQNKAFIRRLCVCCHLVCLLQPGHPLPLSTPPFACSHALLLPRKSRKHSYGN